VPTKPTPCNFARGPWLLWRYDITGFDVDQRTAIQTINSGDHSCVTLVD